MAFVKSGQRLPKPLACPGNVYIIMEKCWLENAKERPKFSDLMDFFFGNYLNYQNLQEIIPYNIFEPKNVTLN